MVSFEKAKLATGEFRADYIRRRLGESATAKAIHAEINAPEMFGGEAGKPWPIGVIYTEQRKLKVKVPALVPAAKPDADEDLDDSPVAVEYIAVPAEYEDILTAEDVADVRAKAAAEIKAAARAQARKELLEKTKRELEHEARLAAQRGIARGDLVDVYIDLAPFAADLRLDGVKYEHGTGPHRVPRKVAAVINEQMQRSWQHEDSLHGANDRPYRRKLIDRGITANNAQAVRVRA